MTMPKFEPACYWIKDAEQFHIGLKPFALAWKPLYTLDQLTEAYEAGKRDAIPEGWVLVPKEPIGWTHSCPVLCLDGVELWIDRCPHCGKPAAAPKGEE